jgi:hypothetical protein
MHIVAGNIPAHSFALVVVANLVLRKMLIMAVLSVKPKLQLVIRR